MFAAERRKKIKEIMFEYKHVDVNTLCSLLDVSLATVRRDLDQLGEEGFLRKEHGGAILVENESDEVQLNLSGDVHTKEKQAVAETAAAMVEEGDAIFIGAGSTCTAFAKQLPKLHSLIVVTNSLEAAVATAYRPEISTVLLGGDVEVLDNRLSTCGMYAHSNMENMYIDKAFLSAQGATIHAGYTVSSREQAMMNKLVMERANETILLMDYTKFGKRALVPFAPLDRFQRIVTNIQVEDKYKEFFYDHAIRLYTAIE